jgi:hypothetical protein
MFLCSYHAHNAPSYYNSGGYNFEKICCNGGPNKGCCSGGCNGCKELSEQANEASADSPNSAGLAAAVESFEGNKMAVT